jgi:hypothetical protein
MTDAELAALEARMITISPTLPLEHVDEPQVYGDTDAEHGNDGDGCVDGEASYRTATSRNPADGPCLTQHLNHPAVPRYPPPVFDAPRTSLTSCARWSNVRRRAAVCDKLTRLRPEWVYEKSPWKIGPCGRGKI